MIKAKYLGERIEKPTPSQKHCTSSTTGLTRQLKTDLHRILLRARAGGQYESALGYGYNRLEEKEEPLLKGIFEPLTEPMMILLIVTAVLFARTKQKPLRWPQSPKLTLNQFKYNPSNLVC